MNKTEQYEFSSISSGTLNAPRRTPLLGSIRNPTRSLTTPRMMSWRNWVDPFQGSRTAFCGKAAQAQMATHGKNSQHQGCVRVRVCVPNCLRSEMVYTSNNWTWGEKEGLTHVASQCVHPACASTKGLCFRDVSQMWPKGALSNRSGRRPVYYSNTEHVMVWQARSKKGTCCFKN